MQPHRKQRGPATLAQGARSTSALRTACRALCAVCCVLLHAMHRVLCSMSVGVVHGVLCIVAHCVLPFVRRGGAHYAP